MNIDEKTVDAVNAANSIANMQNDILKIKQDNAALMEDIENLTKLTKSHTKSINELKATNFLQSAFIGTSNAKSSLACVMSATAVGTACVGLIAGFFIMKSKQNDKKTD